MDHLEGQLVGLNLTFLTSQMRLNNPSYKSALIIAFANEDTQLILAEHLLCACCLSFIPHGENKAVWEQETHLLRDFS